MFGFTSFASAPFASLGTSSGAVTVTLTGVSATGSLGTVTVRSNSQITLTGVQAVGYVGNTLVWGLINEAQTPNWVAVNDSQTPTWVLVNDGNTVLWTEILT